MALDLVQQILEAADTIASKRVEGMKYDSTRVYKIKDASKASTGEYTVTDGSVSFQAYTTDTKLREGQSVYVTIPGSDFDKQKIIVGKYVTSDSDSYVYQYPFDYFLQVSENVVSDNSSYVNTTSVNKVKENPILYSTDPNDLSLLSRGDGARTIIPIWTSKVFDMPFMDFTRFGVRAKFESYFSEDIFQGEYGLLIDLESRIDDDSNNPQYTHQYAWLKSEEDMVGNPYTFVFPQEQEKVFDISTIGDIYRATIYFYQQGNFKYVELDDEGNTVYLPYDNTDDLGGAVENNLFVSDLEAYFGYYKGDITDEKCILYSSNTRRYSSDIANNTKTVYLRWIHRFSEDSLAMISDPDANFGTYSYVDTNGVSHNTDGAGNSLKNCYVYWYRYKLGAPSPDKYAGIHWEKIDPNQWNKIVFEPNVAWQEERIKAIIVLKEYNYIERNNTLNIQDSQVIRTDEMVFINDKDVSSAGSGSQFGLQIKCEDGSFGNYFSYGQDFHLIKQFDNVKEREFGLYLDEKEKVEFGAEGTGRLVKAESITWKFPLRSSMFSIVGIDYSNNSIEEGSNLGTRFQVTISQANNSIVLKQKNVQSAIDIVTYRINKTYSPGYVNNTVFCQVQADGKIYSASLTLNFGLFGTSGTDSTLVLRFLKDTGNVMIASSNASENDERELWVQTQLFDSNNRLVDFSTLEGAKLKYKWYEYFNDPRVTNIPNGKNVQLGTDLQQETSPITNDKGRITYYPKYLVSSSAFNTSNMTNANSIHNCGLYILQVTLTGYGNYDLSAVLPIPMTNWYSDNGGYNVTYQGPTYAIYRSSGAYIDYYKEPVRIFRNNGSDLVIKKNNNDKYRIYIARGLNDAGSDNYLGTIDQDTCILKPCSLYIKDTHSYSIIFFYGSPNGTANNTWWSQPVYVGQNLYPNGEINAWDGKKVYFDDGYILTPAFAAGKKNSDNTFSGVMMGDWSRTNTASDITNGTGIYGFQNGAQTYALHENGSAFFGAPNEGRIYINGDGKNGSSNYGGWIASANFLTDLDLDNNTIHYETGIAKINAIINYQRSGNTASVAKRIGKQGTFLSLKDGIFITNNGYFRGTLHIGANDTITVDDNDTNHFLNQLLASKVGGWWIHDTGIYHTSVNGSGSQTYSNLTHYIGHDLTSTSTNYRIGPVNSNYESPSDAKWALYFGEGGNRVSGKNQGRFGVTTAGIVYADSGYFSGTLNSFAGNIGSWEIRSSGIRHTDANSVTTHYFGTSLFDDAYKVNNTKKSWALYLNGNFGVTSANGTLYANGAVINGNITIGTGQELTIDGGTTSNDYLNDLLGNEIAGWTIWHRGQTNYGLAHLDGTTVTHYMGNGLNSSSYKVNSSQQNWTLYMNSNFGVTKGGTLYANGAVINGNITISSTQSLTVNNKVWSSNDYVTSLVDGSVAGWSIWSSSNTYGLAHVSNNTVNQYMGSSLNGSSYKVNGKQEAWTLYMNGNFGVTTGGVLHAKDAVIKGSLTATSLDIQNANITGQITADNINTTNLSVDATLLTGTLSADRIDAHSISVGKLAGDITSGDWKIDFTNGTLTIGTATINTIYADQIIANDSHRLVISGGGLRFGTLNSDNSIYMDANSAMQLLTDSGKPVLVNGASFTRNGNITFGRTPAEMIVGGNPPDYGLPPGADITLAYYIDFRATSIRNAGGYLTSVGNAGSKTIYAFANAAHTINTSFTILKDGRVQLN